MSPNPRLVPLAASALVAALFMVNSRPAQALPLSFSQSPDPFVAVENSNAIDDTILIKNNSATDTFIISVTNVAFQPIGGTDTATDVLSSVVALGFNPTALFPTGTVYAGQAPLAPGASVALYFEFSTSDTTAPDGDYGLWQALFTVGANDAEGVFQTNIMSANIEVTDPTPLPAALPLFASGLGALGLLGWRRKRKLALAAA
jgi:hypothetical protein